jgi:hypothetical protein
MKTFLKPLGLVLTGFLLCVLSLYSLNYLNAKLFERGYNACIQDTLNSVSTFGHVTIPIVTNEGEQGTIMLAPLTQSTDEEITASD